MIITITNGREYHIAENCPYCQLNTAGQHNIECPEYQPPCQYFGDIVRMITIKPDIKILKYDDYGELVQKED